MKINFTMVLIATLGTSAITFSCGKSNESDAGGSREQTPQVLLPVFSLYGAQNTKWKGICEISTQENLSRQIGYVLQETSMQKTEVVFEGLNCNPTEIRIEFVENWVNVSKYEQDQLKGWTTFSSQLKSITATPAVESIVTKYSDLATYGYNDWKVAESREISGRKYSSANEAEPNAGVVKVRTLKIEGNKLYFARYINGTPQENPDLFFERF